VKFIIVTGLIKPNYHSYGGTIKLQSVLIYIKQVFSQEVGMEEKRTDELDNILKKSSISDFDKFCKNNKDSMNTDSEAFSIYVKELIVAKGLTQQKVFINADIPERYGYKLLSNQKHTKQRDVILRICYAAQMTLDETQRALRKYEMPELYAKNPRDAFLMIAFNTRPGSIIEVNSLLKEKGFDTLRTSGFQD